MCSVPETLRSTQHICSINHKCAWSGICNRDWLAALSDRHYFFMWVLLGLVSSVFIRLILLVVVLISLWFISVPVVRLLVISLWLLVLSTYYSFESDLIRDISQFKLAIYLPSIIDMSGLDPWYFDLLCWPFVSLIHRKVKGRKCAERLHWICFCIVHLWFLLEILYFCIVVSYIVLYDSGFVASVMLIYMLIKSLIYSSLHVVLFLVAG